MIEFSKESLRKEGFLFLVLALACPILLTQCKTAGGSYQDVQYDPSTLKTPDGHGLKKADYPFDDDGKYRKDWVKNKDQGRTRSSYDLPDPEPVVASVEPARISGSIAPMSSPPPPPREPVNPLTSAPIDAVASETSELTAAVLDTPTYHRVKSGETLYSLARKYNTSINELKRVNGLTSDNIRSGQTLRMP